MNSSHYVQDQPIDNESASDAIRFYEFVNAVDRDSEKSGKGKKHPPIFSFRLDYSSAN